MAFNWATIPKDSRLYLVPTAPVVGAIGEADVPGLALGSSQIRFLAADIILAQSGKQIARVTVLADDLKTIEAALPAPHAARLASLVAAVSAPRSALMLPNREASLGFTKPLLMGVLNVTPDSFSDGGKYLDHDMAIAHARAMYSEGADIIDVGGESTRPGAEPVWEGEECERVVPVITALGADNIPISLDSRHATVMAAGLAAGADILNDVSALTYDPDAMAVAASSGAPVVLMHAKGAPKTMQDAPAYTDVLLEVLDYLEARRDAAIAAGIDPSRLILDAGIGFGKRVVQDNVILLNEISALHTLGCPILLGVSRKRFIGALTGEDDAEQRVAGSVAAGLAALSQGVQILRVHDVAATRQAIQVFQGMQDGAAMRKIPTNE